MIQPQTQTRQFWENSFQVTAADIEQLYHYFLDNPEPHATRVLVETIMGNRVTAEMNKIKRQLAGRQIYQPKNTYGVGETLVFPNQAFMLGDVVDSRAGFNPEVGDFTVITVETEGRRREYATGIAVFHEANVGDGGIEQFLSFLSAEDVYTRHGHIVEERLIDSLQAHEDFIYLGGRWFLRSMLVEINIGHLHLAEAVLDMLGGGPTTTDEILPHLDLDQSASADVRAFSLNAAMLRDERFDEVAPRGQVAWFLRRMEPEVVREMPERLAYTPEAYDASLLTTAMLQQERELADEWSDYTLTFPPTSVRFSLIYPHRQHGTLPLNAQLRLMLPLGRSPRQLFTAQDVETGQEMNLWAVKESRCLVGLKDWYEEHGVPVGGYITVKASDDPNVILIDCHRRRSQREDVRLATVNDLTLRFELARRRIACNYDDLMIVGTDYPAAIDGLWRQLQERDKSLVGVLAMLLPELALLSPQGAVHIKTLYSAVNMIYRIPPAPLMATLVTHPAFTPVGDQYWIFDSSRWQRG